jgi:pilus assembly protein CpaD
MQKNFIYKSAYMTGVAVLLLASASCAPIDILAGNFEETATPQNAKLEKKITVSEVTPTVVVDFNPGRAVLNDLEKGKLLGFIEAQDIAFGENVEVELPTFQGSSGLNEQRFGELAGFLQDRGFEVAPRATRENGVNSLRVYFVKYVATVDPDCENGWYKPRGRNYENLPLPNMGCANASALAGMLADPKDLIDPTSESAAIGERAAKAVEKYRAGGASAGSSGGSQ